MVLAKWATVVGIKRNVREKLMELHVPTKDHPQLANYANQFVVIEDGINTTKLQDAIREDSIVFPFVQNASGGFDPLQTTSIIFEGPYFLAEAEVVTEEGKEVFMMLVTQYNDVHDENADQVRSFMRHVEDRMVNEKKAGKIALGFGLNAAPVQSPGVRLLFAEYKSALQKMDYLLTPARNPVETMLSYVIGRLGTGINVHTNQDARDLTGMVEFGLELVKKH